MRRLAAVFLALACAHGPRAIEPSAWRELRTEHFHLRTDLRAEEARSATTALEDVRAGLLAIGWQAGQSGRTPVEVIEFARRADMADYAAAGVEGFVSEDGFGDPIM